MTLYKVILGTENSPHIREIEFNENSGEIYLDENQIIQSQQCGDVDNIKNT